MAEAIALYSVSVLDLATTLCFLLFQEIKLPPIETQYPEVESEWVRPTNDVPVRATETNVVELEFWQSSYHLRNSLKITKFPVVSDEIRSTVADLGGGSEWIIVIDRVGCPWRVLVNVVFSLVVGA